MTVRDMSPPPAHYATVMGAATHVGDDGTPIPERMKDEQLFDHENDAVEAVNLAYSPSAHLQATRVEMLRLAMREWSLVLLDPVDAPPNRTARIERIEEHVACSFSPRGSCPIAPGSLAGMG